MFIPTLQMFYTLTFFWPRFWLFCFLLHDTRSWYVFVVLQKQSFILWILHNSRSFYFFPSTHGHSLTPFKIKISVFLFRSRSKNRKKREKIDFWAIIPLKTHFMWEEIHIGVSWHLKMYMHGKNKNKFTFFYIFVRKRKSDN